jgi:rhodanese-related sulfurtransferase
VRDEGALLLDVRSPSEFASGHVDGARNIPHDQIANRIAEVRELQGGDASRPIVVYCRSGGRSAAAKRTLRDNGFEKVTNLGGIAKWCEDC